MDEMDAIPQLIRLTRDRKLKNEEEQSTGDSTADLSFSSMIQKIRSKYKNHECWGHDTARMEAAQQLLQLCDNSNRYKYKDVKAKEEEEEDEESNSDTSYITDDSSPAMETNLAAQQIMQLRRNSDSKDTEEREEEAKGGGEEESKSNTSSVIKGGVFMKGCEAFCPRKRKFRSIVDIYRTTKPFD
ncbi:hypothetical protein HYC85_009963 [Camellia sinensis]|uniref:Uncharacterized protein n=1 Tax=Camellia sinensis TaxID=4442 RepID=A0A7J7HH28_CAMSI|nr:hypothetical protein HYC85_009963 [Camellia sinensis]